MYHAYNKPLAVLDWMSKTDIKEDFVLVIDADMIMREAFDPAVRARWGAVRGAVWVGQRQHFELADFAQVRSALKALFLGMLRGACCPWLPRLKPAPCPSSCNSNWAPSRAGLWPPTLGT